MLVIVLTVGVSQTPMQLGRHMYIGEIWARK